MTEDLTQQIVKTLVVNIRGMHCSHCEVLIERKLSAIPSVQWVDVSFRKGLARIIHWGNVDTTAVQNTVEEEGYTVVSWEERDGAAGQERNTLRDYAEIGAAFLILAGIFLMIRQLDFVSHGFVISENIGYGIAFVIGLLASVSSCMAVTGGLLVALAAKYNEVYPELGAIQRLKPHIYFNVGRIASYTLLGGAIGALGAAISLSTQAISVLTIAASLVMIVLGLQMLKLFPSVGRFFPVLPKSFTHRIHDFAARNSKSGAFMLGALTFFLPCGFTQALQLYVLTKGSFATGALTMLVFTLVTLPALLSLSAMSSFAKGTFQKHFLRLAGAAVIMLGFLNIQYGLVLAGSSINLTAPIGGTKLSSAASEQSVPAQVSQAKEQPAPAPLNQAKEQNTAPVEKRAAAPQIQTIAMKVRGFDYFPHRFTVKQGIPVEWWIDASGAAGCGRFIMVPKIGVRKLLSANSSTLITFTPEEPGDIAFNCGMGMMTPGSKITVVSNSKG